MLTTSFCLQNPACKQLPSQRSVLKNSWPLSRKMKRWAAYKRERVTQTNSTRRRVTRDASFAVLSLAKCQNHLSSSPTPKFSRYVRRSKTTSKPFCTLSSVSLLEYGNFAVNSAIYCSFSAGHMVLIHNFAVGLWNMKKCVGMK